MPTTNINAAQANILRAIAGGKPGDPVPVYELVKPNVVKERCGEYGPNRPDVLFLARESCIGFQGSPSSVELTPRGVAALQQYESNPVLPAKATNTKRHADAWTLAAGDGFKYSGTSHSLYWQEVSDLLTIGMLVREGERVYQARGQKGPATETPAPYMETPADVYELTEQQGKILALFESRATEEGNESPLSPTISFDELSNAVRRMFPDMIYSQASNLLRDMQDDNLLAGGRFLMERKLTPLGLAAFDSWRGRKSAETKLAEPEKSKALDYADFQLISRALIVAEVAREKTTDLFSRELARETDDADRAERLQRLLDGDAAELERIATLRAKLARIFCGK